MARKCRCTVEVSSPPSIYGFGDYIRSIADSLVIAQRYSCCLKVPDTESTHGYENGSKLHLLGVKRASQGSNRTVALSELVGETKMESLLQTICSSHHVDLPALDAAGHSTDITIVNDLGVPGANWNFVLDCAFGTHARSLQACDTLVRPNSKVCLHYRWGDTAVKPEWYFHLSSEIGDVNSLVSRYGLSDSNPLLVYAEQYAEQRIEGLNVSHVIENYTDMDRALKEMAKCDVLMSGYSGFAALVRLVNQHGLLVVDGTMVEDPFIRERVSQKAVSYEEAEACHQLNLESLVTSSVVGSKGKVRSPCLWNATASTQRSQSGWLLALYTLFALGAMSRFITFRRTRQTNKIIIIAATIAAACLYGSTMQDSVPHPAAHHIHVVADNKIGAMAHRNYLCQQLRDTAAVSYYPEYGSLTHNLATNLVGASSAQLHTWLDFRVAGTMKLYHDVLVRGTINTLVIGLTGASGPSPGEVMLLSAFCNDRKCAEAKLDQAIAHGENAELLQSCINLGRKYSPLGVHFGFKLDDFMEDLVLYSCEIEVLPGEHWAISRRAAGLVHQPLVWPTYPNVQHEPHSMGGPCNGHCPCFDDNRRYC